MAKVYGKKKKGAREKKTGLWPALSQVAAIGHTFLNIVFGKKQ